MSTPRPPHELKCWPGSFQAVWEQKLRCQLRRADRDYQPHDWLLLREWKPDTEDYTGREIAALVLHVERGPAPGLEDGWALLSIAVESRHGASARLKRQAS